MDNLTEQDHLLSGWAEGSFQTPEENVQWHFTKHGQSVEAADVLQYLRKAEAFRQEKRGGGSPVAGHTPGVRRFRKQERYIDLTLDGKIVSFGMV